MMQGRAPAAVAEVEGVKGRSSRRSSLEVISVSTYDTSTLLLIALYTCIYICIYKYIHTHTHIICTNGNVFTYFATGLDVHLSNNEITYVECYVDV